MAIEEKVIGQEQTDEEKESARLESEAARTRAIEEANEKARQAELEKAKLEGELNALKGQKSEPQVVPQWTDDQWEAEGAKIGMTGAQAKASVAIAQNASAQTAATLEKRIAAAEERARKAEERAAGLETRSGSKEFMSEFFSSNPQFAGHKKDIGEFVEMFPESDRNDPEKLKTILEKAKTYVRGKVGTVKTGNAGSAKLGGGVEEEETEEQVNFAGLDDKSLRSGLGTIAEELKEKLADKERAERLKKAESSDGRGVRYDFEAEFKAEEARRKNRR